MNMDTRAVQQSRGKWLFLGVFVFACLLFWWLPSMLFRFVLHTSDPVADETIAISVIALLSFCGGFLLPVNSAGRCQIPGSLADVCEKFAYRATLWCAAPALAVALLFFCSRSGMDYGSGTTIPGAYQAVLYLHLFLGFLYLGLAEPEKSGWRPVTKACALLIAPRLLISLHWGRFFVAQALVPIVLLAMARGWAKLSLKRAMQLVLLAAVIIFVPSLTRGDNLGGGGELVQFFASGSTLRLYQDNLDLNLNGRCPPLLVSLTMKIVPYHALGVCVIDLWGETGRAATLDRILAYNTPGSDVQLTGPGSNYLLELYLTGGLTAVFVGSALFGFICRRMVAAISTRSLFAGIWAECLTRALMAPRGDLGYVFERVPSLLATTAFIVCAIVCVRLLQSGVPPLHQTAIPQENT